MEHVTIKSDLMIFHYGELAEEDRMLVDIAREATANSYSPYSHFCVGAAVRLEDRTVIRGANQENAAFSVTMCAERSAIFNAQSNYPHLAITHIAIAAKNIDGFVKNPVSPCGSCRQAILEIEQRYGRDIKILLCGVDVIYVFDSIKALLPLSFVDDSMR